MINKYTRDIKLADFGSVLPITRAPLESFLGTRKYASPQVLNNIPYNQILQESWALGVLLFAISFRVEPFRNADDIIMKDINYVILVTRKMFLDTANGFYVTDDITDAIASLMHKEERLRTSFTDLRNSSPFARYCRKIL